MSDGRAGSQVKTAITLVLGLVAGVAMAFPSAPLVAQSAAPPPLAEAPSRRLGPSPAGAVFLSGLHLADRPAATADWWLTHGQQFTRRRRAPPELIGALLDMGVGFAAGSVYGVYHEIQHCSWVCGMGPAVFGMAGAGYGILIGAAGGVVSRLF